MMEPTTETPVAETKSPATSESLVATAFAEWGLTLAQALEARRAAMATAGKPDDAKAWLRGALASVAVAAMRPALRAVKMGRNNKCPCGSGKKYKACCGARKLARKP